MSGEAESPRKVMSSKKQKPLIKATGIFWDLEDLPIPPGVSPFNIHENVNSALVAKGLPVDWCSFFLYAGEQKFSDDMVKCFEEAGMTFQSIESFRRKRKFNMFRDIHQWAAVNPLSQSLVGTLVVVSSISRKSHVRTLLSMQRCGYNLLLVHPKAAQTQTLGRISTQPLEWLWTIMFREPSIEKSICSCALHRHSFFGTSWITQPLMMNTATENIELAFEAMDYIGKAYFFFYSENPPLPLEKMELYKDGDKMHFYLEGDAFKRAYKMFLDTITWTRRYVDETPHIPVNVVLVSKTIPDEPRFVHVLSKLRPSCTSFHVIHPEEEPSRSVLSTLPPTWLSRSACGEKPNVVPCDNCAECKSTIAEIKALGKLKF